jgi:Tol biopolymer transport system component
MNSDGSNQTRLTNNPAYDMSPFWSPDGTQITFDTQRDHYPPAKTGIGPEFEIHRINADGSEDTRLTNNNEEDRFPSWGPNGLIAFSSNGSLVIMNSDGSKPIKLLDSGMFPDWRP